MDFFKILILLQIHETDELPKMICADCVYKLDLFFNFREKSLQTESFLIDLLKKVHETPITNKLNEQKMVCSQQAINIRQALANHQQLDLQNQELLEQTTNMQLVHELSKNETLTVEEDIILNTQNIDMNNPLDSIELSTHGLQPDDMSNSIHSQELNLQHEASIGELVEDMQHSQLTVQNLDLIHSQHNLMVDQFDMKANENKMTLIGMKHETELNVKVRFFYLSFIYGVIFGL